MSSPHLDLQGRRALITGAGSRSSSICSPPSSQPGQRYRTCEQQGPSMDTQMATTQAGADLGYDLRPVNEVAAEIVAGLEERRIDINTQHPERRAMQELNAQDPLAVDAALAPKLAELRAAVSTHRSI
jgi:hypothetical protein